MGCDIHMLTEMRRKSSEKWVNTDNWRYESYEQEEGEEKLDLEAVYRERDYNLFARLAGVREYGVGLSVLAQPRGIPNDVSPITKKHIDYWDSDGHSHSYATYEELKQYQYEHAWDSHQLRVLMDALKERMIDVLWIRGGTPTPEDEQNFRIVFFFDN